MSEGQENAIEIVDSIDFDPATFIHVIRDRQIVLDSDLATLYEVETKYLNRTATRNANRFPEDFRFQLSAEEYESLRCQFGTSNEKGARGGRRYMPYAYTEQGVAMLSGLLNSKSAVNASIGIMRAFVEMRRYLVNNAALLDRMTTVEFRQLQLEEATKMKFDRVFQYIESNELPQQKIFYKGELFDARVLLSDIVKSARNSITLVDGYVDDKTLELLAKKAEGVVCRIITFPSASLSGADIEAFSVQYGPIIVTKCTEFHDRFLIVDDAVVYHIGASLKDAGKKTFAVSVLEDECVAGSLKERISRLSLVS